MVDYNKLVTDYINGNLYSEELEDNRLFMQLVLKRTNDCKMYNFCSDRLKKDGKFIKFVIQNFQNNQDFICKIANDYFNYIENSNISLDDNLEERINYIEICILMDNILSKNNNNQIQDYKIKTFILYQTEIFDISLEITADKELSKYGKGFVFIFDEYESSPIVLNCFAKRMIDEIFYQDETSLEKLVHSKFKKAEDIKKFGINSFIIKSIYEKDPYLSNYVSTNISLILDIKKDITKIISNWDNYLKNLNERRIYILEQEIQKYLEETDNNEYSFMYILYFIARRLNIMNIFDTNNYFDILKIDDCLHSKYEDILLPDSKTMQHLVAMTKKIFNQDVIDEKPDDYVSKSKVLVFQNKGGVSN